MIYDDLTRCRHLFSNNVLVITAYSYYYITGFIWKHQMCLHVGTPVERPSAPGVEGARLTEGALLAGMPRQR